MNANAWLELALVIATVLIGGIAGTWAIIRALGSLLHRLMESEVSAPIEAIQASVADVQESVRALSIGQNEHATRLTRLETAMELNGCLDIDGKPVCGRKR